MKKLILGLILGITSLSAVATESLVFKTGKNVITILLAPCDTKAGVFATMPDTIRSEFQAAKILWDGKEFAGCWAAKPGSVYLIDETGDQGEIPMSEFKKPDVI